MALNDAELRFQAQLEDNVSPNLDKLQKQLRQMGATPAQVRMVIQAVDEATPKVQQAKRQVESLPKEHIIKVKVDDTGYQRSMANVKAEAAKPIKLNFLTNLDDIANQMFSFRTRMPMPGGGMGGGGMAGSMLTAYGPPGAAVAGAVGAVGQGVSINSQMEQSMVTLTQTLKDSTAAQNEMKDLVKFAQKTPFSYSDVMSADVRLRSYQIPAQQGGPNNQGWLPAAGNMAAAMNTPIQQAVEAIADARQGYFVRMMSYGIRMMREDFQKGGRYAGMSYEQGLTQAIRRFEGSMEMQSKTFQGVMSNLGDILQQQILKPLGAPAFDVAKQGAQKLQDALMDPVVMEKVANLLEDIQHRMVDFYAMVQRGKDYFKDNLLGPITSIVEQVTKLGLAFGKGFIGTFIDALKTGARVANDFVQPFLKFVNMHGPIVEIAGAFKALSMMGFSSMESPLRLIKELFIPSTSISGVKSFVGALMDLPKALATTGMLLLVKNFEDARYATKELRAEFSKAKDGSPFEKINNDIRIMAHGLGEGTQAMQHLVVTAGQGLRGAPLSDLSRMQASVRAARYGAVLGRDEGLDANQATRMIAQEMKRANSYTEAEAQKAATEVKALGDAANAVGVSFKDVTRMMSMFKGELEKLGLGGTRGGAVSAALTGTFNDRQLRTLFQNYTNPSIDSLRNMQPGTPGHRPFDQALSYYDWRSLPDSNVMKSDQVFGDIGTRYAANRGASRLAQRQIGAIAPSAQLPPMSQPFIDQNMAVPWQRLRSIQDPREQARAMMSETSRQKGFIDDQTTALQKLQEQLTKVTGWQTNLSQATDNLNQQMQKFQRTLLPIQQHIERLGYEIAKYQFDNIRPLERAMQRLTDANTILSNSMRTAQYEMQNYSSGLLDGEQAILDQLHALENYNKQLQWLQLQYSSIGSELGRQTFDRGASVRVAPLMGLNLAMQQERLQRQQQRKQLEYDMSYGEQHYQMQQASRSRLERQEIPYDTRMEHIRHAAGNIDTLTDAQRRNADAQGRIQEQLIPYNERMQDMQDSVTKLNIRLQKANTSKYAQGLQTQIADLGIANGIAGQKVTYLNQAIGAQEALIDDVKDSYKTLNDNIAASILFGEKSPEDTARRLINSAYQRGDINFKTRQEALKNIEKAAAAVRTSKEVAVRDDAKWSAIISQGIKGFFGDDWRVLGSWIKRQGQNMGGPLGGALGGLGSGFSAVAPMVAPLTMALAGTGMASFGARFALGRTLGFMADTTQGSVIASRAAVRMRNRAERMGARYDPESRRGRFWANRAAQADEFATAPGRFLANRWVGESSFMRGMGRQWNLGRRALTTVARPFATAVGFGLGGPVGAFEANRRVTNFFESRSVRQAIADMVKGGASVFTGGRRMARAATQMPGAVKDAVKNIPSDTKKAIEEAGGHNAKALKAAGESTAKRLAEPIARMSKPAEEIATAGRRFGRAGAVIGAAAATFKFVGDHFSSVLGKMADMLHLPGGSNAIEDAGKAVRDATRFGRGGRLAGRAARAAGKAVPWIGGAYAFNQLAQGDVAGAADTASYMIPGVGEVRMGMDVINAAFPVSGKNPGITNAQQAGAMMRAFAPQMHQTMAGRRDPDLSDEERRDLERNRRRQAALAQEITDRAKHGLDVTKQYADLYKVQTSYDDKYYQYAKDTKDRVYDMNNKWGVKLLAAEKSLHDARNRQEADGYAGIYKTTDKYLDQLHRRISRFKRNLGLTDGGGDNNPSYNSGTKTPGDTTNSDLRHGAANGLLSQHILKGKGDSKGYLIRVGEEEDEMIIPLAPHRRERAKSLISQAAGVIGMANGGSVDPAYRVAKAAYETAAGSFVNGGVPHAAVRQAGEAITHMFPDLFVGYTTGGHHAANSYHYRGMAEDIDGPQKSLDRAARWIANSSLAKLLTEGIHNPGLSIKNGTRVPPSFWGSSTWAEHGNHIHIAIDDTGNVHVPNLGNIASLGGLGRLPNPPRELQHRGLIGQILHQALRRTRREAGHVGDMAPSLEGFTGGGSETANMRLGARMAAAMGWRGGQWDALKRLWIGESGWKTRVSNYDGSGAYGIPQALPGDKMASAGADWRTNPATQIKWGLGYIKDRYKTPANALSLWTSRVPHWYAPGIDRVETDRLAMLHAGERVQNVAEASTARARRGTERDPDSTVIKILRVIEDIQDKIKKTEKHLSNAEDRASKRGDARDLASLNNQLRERFGALRGAQRGAARGLAHELRGDTSGGEQTEAFVRREQNRFHAEVNRDEHRDTQRVRTARTLHRTAQTLVRTAKGHRQKRLARTAVRATGRAIKSAQAVTRYTHKHPAAVRQVARARYVVGAAKRGVSRRLIRDITGKGLTRKASAAYSRVQRTQRAAKRAPTAQHRAAARSATKNLERIMQRGLSASAKHLQALRSQASRDGKAARTATDRAARAQNRALDKHGRLLAGHVAKVAGNIKTEGSKGRAATSRVENEQKKGRGDSKQHDDKRTKAEVNADRREKDFQKRALKFLEDLSKKDMSVTVHNKAVGASLDSNVQRKGGRAR